MDDGLLSQRHLARLDARVTKQVNVNAPACECGCKMVYLSRSAFLHMPHDRRSQKRREARVVKLLKLKRPLTFKPWQSMIHFTCRKCKKSKEQRMLLDELATFSLIDKANDFRGTAMHRLYHAFCKRFTNWPKDKSWKWQGWDLMKRIERAERGPLKGMQLLRCDDDVHASSMLAVIPHEVRINGRLDEYWGTTVIAISQCSGDPPVRFFLYGCHARPLHALLGRVVKAHARNFDDM